MSKLKEFPERLLRINDSFCQEVPSVTDTQQFITSLIEFLFPIKSGNGRTLSQIQEQLDQFQKDFKYLILPFDNKLGDSLDNITLKFFEAIPDVYSEMLYEADAYLRFDPAAYSIEEIILCYPGFYCISIHRLAHILYELNIPIIPRVISEFAHSRTGIDIHPGAKIGKKFFIDHGTGIVIGETSEIGENVKIYQGVTLGALHVEKKMANKKRHPTIEDNVIIYAGSTILGGETIIGHDTVIGGNVWLTSSVMPHTVVYRQPKIYFRDSKNYTDPINFVI